MSVYEDNLAYLDEVCEDILSYLDEVWEDILAYLDEVSEDKLTDDCGDAEKSKSITNIKNSLLQRELSCQAFNIDDELQPINLQDTNCFIE